MAMLRSLVHAAVPLDVVFAHVARRREDAIFAPELDRLARQRDGIQVHRHYSSELGGFDPTALARLVPDHGERTTLLCGPTGFMATVRSHFAERGLAARLLEESFGAGPSGGPLAEPGGAFEVRCMRSERLFTAAGATPLLAAAEQAGLHPRYGCRMGICHSCSCVKRSGTVENLHTGAVSSEPGERIQLCISRARTDLTLEL
jgi:ferredoxin-NADP reductase